MRFVCQTYEKREARLQSIAPPPTIQIYLHLMGQYRLQAPNGKTADLKTRRYEEVLAFLALHHDRGASRDTLLATFWPEHTEESARNNLRQALHSIRQLLSKLQSISYSSSDWILEDHQHLRLNPDAIVTDIAQFEQYIHDGNRESALCHYRGELLPNWGHEWVIAPRQHLVETFLANLKPLIQQSRRESDLAQAITYALQAREADPLSEDACQTLIELYQETNHPVEARRTYDAYTRRLRDALQMEPPQHLKHLLSTAQEPTLAPIVTTTLTEAQPKEEIPQEKPSLTSLPALPYNTTRFFGRKTEIDDISLLLKNGAKLVTITGFGGMGKTRLSQEIAERLLSQQQYPAIYWVALTETRETEQIWSTIRTALPTKPTSGEYQSPQEQVLQTLNEKPTLLLLDNLEHLPEAILHPILTQLLAQIPTLTILTTSRKRLRLRGEQVYELNPLPLPTAKDSPEMQQISPCIRLFLDRAVVDSNTSLSAINSLCHHLEGIPLAIEMAAARTRLLSPEQILTRLKGQQKDVLTNSYADAPDRHRSLQATLQWSFDLLSPAAQQLLGEISVLRGKWTMEAAEAMSAQDSILEAMSELLDASLIRAEQEAGERYFLLLETMRQFGDMRLSATERTSLKNNHAKWVGEYLNNIRQSKIILNKVATMDAIQDNYIVALEWTFNGEGSFETGLFILSPLLGYWFQSGNVSMGIYWNQRALDTIVLSDESEFFMARVLDSLFLLVLMKDDQDFSNKIELKYSHLISFIKLPEALGGIYNAIAALRSAQHNIIESRLYYQKAHDLLGNHPKFNGSPLMNLVNICVTLEEWEKAAQLAQEGVTLFKENPRSYSIFVCLLGAAQTQLLQLDSAKKHLDHSMEMFLAIGEQVGICRGTQYRGMWHLLQNQFTEAVTCFRTAGLMAVEIQDGGTVTGCLIDLIEATKRQGNPRRAMRLLGIQQARVVHRYQEAYEIEGSKRVKSEIEAALGGGDPHDDFAYGMALSPEEGLAYAFEAGETEDEEV
jgi:predicted ATPase/DNA-binding SARP family transcriptional activator